VVCTSYPVDEPRLEWDDDGRLVAQADTVVTDEMMFGLIDSGRR